MPADEKDRYPQKNEEEIDEDLGNTYSGIKYMSYGYISGFIGMVLVVLMTFLFSSTEDKSRFVFPISSLISMLSMVLILIDSVVIILYMQEKYWPSSLFH